MSEDIAKKEIDLKADALVNEEEAEEERVHVSEEDNKRILRATDKVILVILTWVYFLQILDKSVVGYSSVFGLSEDTGMTGDQYSILGSAGYYGQIAIQPISAVCLVKVPTRIFMPFIVFAWGVSLTCMAAAHNFTGLIVTRTLLGIFEAACLPLFTVVTMTFYRRVEQPMRIATFYSTNGLATILGSLLAYGLGHIKGTLHSYQIIFLVTGLATVLTAPFVYWKYDNTPAEARFLSPEDRKKAVERLRANQQGIHTTKFEIKQVFELLYDVKAWVFVVMTLLLNAGASVTNVFGPLIIQGFGFDPYQTTLLNMPFGAVQFLVVVASSYCAYKFRYKSVIIFLIIIPVVIGLAMMYALGRSKSEQGPLLVGYYLMGFLFGGNPLIVSWMAANLAGNTKKSAMVSIYNAASAAGNIIGPLLFRAKDAPYYKYGLSVCLAFFSILAALVVVQVFVLMFYNKLQEKKRVKVGKPAKLKDYSMSVKYVDTDEQTGDDAEIQKASGVGEKAFSSLTDRQNEDFIYVY